MGIIIPALINGLSIPLFKNELGAKDYGQYALYFNAMLISNLLISGWLSQSILRFYAKAADKNLFARQVSRLSFQVGAIGFLPATIIVFYINGSFVTGLIFGLLLFLAAVQLPLQSLCQSAFLSKVAAGAEAIRTISWLLLSVVFLKLHIPFLQALLSAIAISYLLSILYLYRENDFLKTNTTLKASYSVSSNFYRYGWPFSLWFICYYLSGYIDKVFMLRYSGSYLQGNYNAIYDFISKSAGLILAPVLTAAVPLLTEAFEQKQFITVKKLVRRLVITELIALLAFVALYYLGGYRILFWLLNIPANNVYLHSGMLVIVGTMFWQMAILLQKPAELKYKSLLLLFNIGIALAAQYFFYFITSSKNPLIFPAGFCLASLIYCCLILCSKTSILSINNGSSFLKPNQ